MEILAVSVEELSVKKYDINTSSFHFIVMDNDKTFKKTRSIISTNL